MKLELFTESEIDYKKLLETTYSDAYKNMIENSKVLVRTDKKHYKKVYVGRRDTPRASKYNKDVSHITQYLSKWDSRWSEFDDRAMSIFGASRKGDINRVATAIGWVTHAMFVPNGGKYNVCGGADFNFPMSWKALGSFLQQYSEDNLFGVRFAELLQTFSDVGIDLRGKNVSEVIKEIGVAENNEGTVFDRNIINIIKTHPEQTFKALDPAQNGFFVTNNLADVPENREVWTDDPVLLVPVNIIKEMIAEN